MVSDQTNIEAHLIYCYEGCLCDQTLEPGPASQ